ncbi:unnamed protein product [Kuraishia capsulata CBS 1993]|uniref:BSD domain-containing protein n=1 Tax=Kuraishia capsulata CBS 1993 TaxID=1382522 RepID=W6MRM2_9ASCO|nr:uncharacterized protein KUCA_T00005352001 [Kuraishia capsulata CBS 1993]CDK29364.1 unnamed protein product [Kuraishia capsulata CBS 1993]
MDFYEPEKESMADSTETLKANTSDAAKPALEANVEKLYDNLEAKGKRGWSTFNGLLSNFQKNLPDYLDQTKTRIEQTKQQLEQLAVGESGEGSDSTEKPKIVPKELLKNLSNVTNEYLDELDDDLQKIETLGIGYATKLGSFLKDAIKVQLPQDNAFDGDETLENSEVLFGVPEEGAFSSRAEIQLQELRSSQEVYLRELEDPEDYAHFLETDKPFEQNEIEALFAAFTSLKAVHDSLVPASISNEDFWRKYRYEKDRIVKEEQRRKLLLERSSKSAQEEFDWDDEEEEAAKEKKSDAGELKESTNDSKSQEHTSKTSPRTSSELSLESASSSTLEVVSSKKSKEPKPAEEDDEEDDWE